MKAASEYSVTCAQMKRLEQQTDAAGLSYYQMMENAGTIAANRIVEITMTSPIDNANAALARPITEENTDTGADTEPGRVRPVAWVEAKAAEDMLSTVSEAPKSEPEKSPAPRRYAYALHRPIRARVYCGKGNNGGDGFVVARLLARRGWQVEVILVDGVPTTPDAITNYELLQRLEIPVKEIPVKDLSAKATSGTEPSKVTGASDARRQSEQQRCGSASQIGDATKLAPKPTEHPEPQEASIPQAETILQAPPDVVVDAIYGTGFHGKLREAGAAAAAQIAAARSQGAWVFALDIPSGMGGDLTAAAELNPRCVQADVTITFHAKKPVHLQPFASEYCGRIITADIGIVDEDKPGSRRKFSLDAGETYTFEDFVEIIGRLRAPDGCPWDRAQTHETLKKYFLEETQEAIAAIDNKDDANLCEELGDVLLQIVLHAQIARERGAFTMDDCIQGICEKMIRRHPWVFGDMKVSSPEEGERIWEEIKRQEKAAKD